MQAERATIRFMAEYQSIWFRHFPDLSRRAQWHIVSHICGKARDGSPVGELSGMVKQLFLLDDATVRERLGELYRLGFCAIDPPDRPVSARTIILPTPELLDRFDAHLRELAQHLFTAAREVAPDLRGGAPNVLDDATRRALLHAVECCNERCQAELDHGFAASGISMARRLEAKRHLLSPSHWLLVQLALERCYEASPQADDGDGMLADDMAAELLKLLRQNFQTTRDHIGYLVQLGLLERRQGRALRVALAQNAAAALHSALGEAAAALVEIAQSVASEEDPLERTWISAPVPQRAPDPNGRQHVLTVTRDGEPERRILLGDAPLVIGRAPTSGLMLPASEVSRTHCRIDAANGRLTVTDLESTNGTFVDGLRIAAETGLQSGAVLQVGPYRMVYVAEEPLANVEVTLQIGEAPSNVTPLRPASRRGAG